MIDLFLCGLMNSSRRINTGGHTGRRRRSFATRVCLFAQGICHGRVIATKEIGMTLVLQLQRKSAKKRRRPPTTFPGVAANGRVPFHRLSPQADNASAAGQVAQTARVR